jgi:Spy/CpxP family protein refolding chaperone
MKKHLAVLSFAVAALCAAPTLLHADDAIPPKPPGGDKAPAEGAKTPADSGKRSAEAGGRRGGANRFSPEERLKRMTTELGLTQEQQDKIKPILEKSASQMKEFIAKGRDNLTEEDRTKIRELLKGQADEIAAVLTPEQKEKFKAAMEKRRAEGGRRGGGAK